MSIIQDYHSNIPILMNYKVSGKRENKTKHTTAISLSLRFLADQTVGEAKNKGTAIKLNRLSVGTFSQQAGNLKENTRKKKNIRKTQNWYTVWFPRKETGKGKRKKTRFFLQVFGLSINLDQRTSLLCSVKWRFFQLYQQQANMPKKGREKK